jgi:N-acetylglucosamine-6-phosphate deacetylase
MAELICDGVHVHPSLMAMAIRLKSDSGIMAITDGTAAAGLPVGSRAQLGDQAIIAAERNAVLENGTLAGSVLTMDGAFRTLVTRMGVPLPDAARMCASTPARAMGLAGTGTIAVGQAADLTVLSANLRVVQTYVGGRAALEH